MLGRISVSTFRSLSRAVFGVSAKQTLFAQAVTRPSHLPRFFSNTAPGFSAAQQELVSALQNEIDAEKKLEAENLGGSVSPSIPGFRITTKDAEVRLKKTHGNEEILVVFNVNHSVEVSEEESTDNDLSPVPVALPPVAIEITKGEKRLCFNVELVPTNDQQYDFCVEEFYVADAAKNDDEAVEDTVYASSGKYIDPSLHDLLFVSYLEERGLDANFCHQLVNFATHYEHGRYVGLLENIKAFVSK